MMLYFRRYIFLTLLLLFSGVLNSNVVVLSAQDIGPEGDYLELFERLTGRYEPTEVPDDFQSGISWRSTPMFSDFNDGTRYLFHERFKISSPARPVLQMVMKIESFDSGTVLSYLHIPKKIRQYFSQNKPPIVVLEEYAPSDLLPVPGQRFVFHKRYGEFVAHSRYPTVFRGSAYGIVEMRVGDATIYNWTRYFTKNGVLVYGPEKSGYYLKRVD